MQHIIETYQNAYTLLEHRRCDLLTAMKRPGISRKDYDDLDHRQRLLHEEAGELMQQVYAMNQYPYVHSAKQKGGRLIVEI